MKEKKNIVSKFREQNVYILRGTVVDAPAKYTEKKRKKEAEKNTNVLDIHMLR